MNSELPAGLAESLELHVRALAANIGERSLLRPAALERAAEYVESSFRERGLAARSEFFEAQGLRLRNLAADLREPGEEPFLIVGAHYDSARCPGADDNASGVAVLLELASMLRREPPRIPVRLVAFSAEEYGVLGSWHSARRSRELGERVMGMLSLEMLGYYDDSPGSQRYPPLLSRFFPDRGDFLALVSNLRSHGFRSRLARALREGMSLPLESASLPLPLAPAIALSDHWPYWRMGYPAAMLTDTAFLRNPNYHRDSDLPETLDYRRMAAAAAGLAAALRLL